MDYDPDLNNSLEVLDFLVDYGLLEQNSPAYGIAQLYLYKGESSLSKKQKAIFTTYVAPFLFKKCDRCDQGIEFLALANAYSEGVMLCSYHMHKHHKDE